MDRISKTRQTAALATLLAIATLAVYWPVGHHDFLRYDDSTYVTYNPRVASGLTWENAKWAMGSGYASNWHPVTWISHMLDVQCFGLNPGWHHSINLLIHTLNALLLFGLLRTLTRAEYRSWFVATLFALHPLHVESVAWVAERKDVLSAFFFILTLWTYSQYVRARHPDTRSAEPPEEHRESESPALTTRLPGRKYSPAVYYGLALGLYALGLMSKPMLVTLPFVLLLLDFWPLERLRPGGTSEQPVRRGSLIGRLVLEKLPFLCLAIGTSVVTYLVQEKGRAVSLNLGMQERVFNAANSYLKYLQKTFWPSDLAIFYPHPNIANELTRHSWQLGLMALLLGVISVLAVVRARRSAWLATGWFWYLGMLVPVIGVIQVGGQAMADRYTYLPLIGIFVIVTWGAAESLANLRLGRVVLTGIAVLAIASCMASTRNQLGHWRNNLAVFEHALAVTQHNAVAHSQVGIELAEQGKYPSAIEHFQKAIAADPSSAEAHFGLGLSFEGMRKPADAAREYASALQLRPGYWLACNRLAAMFWSLNQPQEASQQYAEALRLNPGDFEAHFFIGTVLADRGEDAKAQPHFAEAVRLKPDYSEALGRLAQTLLRLGKVAEAEEPYRSLVRLHPTNAELHINLGGILWQTGKQDEAVRHYAEAVRLSPEHPMAHYNLGLGLSAQGKLNEAESEFMKAVRLKPDYPEAIVGLGRAMMKQNKLEQAEAQFQSAIRLGPNAQAYYNLALVRVAQGRTSAAIASCEEALKLRPDWPGALSELAWILATDPESQLRDGQRAVKLAERACELTGNKEPRALAALDAAYAEAGRFPQAISAAERSAAIALAAGEKQIAQEATERKELYKTQQAHRSQKTK